MKMLNQSGQGLLETIIALGIIVSGIVGMLTLTLSNQSGSIESSERLIATHLAREGVEVVRNMRDSSWIVRGVWDQGLENGTDYSTVPLFDTGANTWSLQFAPNDLAHSYTRLWRQGGVYFQDDQDTVVGATLTDFRRLLRLDEICEDKTVATDGAACPALNPKIGIRLQSIVQWESKGSTSQLIAEEQLFNWR
ncbi:MAG: hypothetical protein HY462_01825 [Parcubacteria group bacterium]|nr:hypothetical protein [Parcubacteria group bacterium]